MSSSVSEPEGNPPTSKNVEKEKITRLFEAMCRCCCAQQNNLTSIFDAEAPSDEMIYTFTMVRFTKDDSYPQNICADCITMLNNCNSFRQQVQAADKFLREFKSAREEIQEDEQDCDLPFDIPENSMCDQDILVDFGLISDSDNEKNAFQEVIDIDSDGASEEIDDLNDDDYVEEENLVDAENGEMMEKTASKKKNDNLICETCKRSFASKDFYRKHMDEHSFTNFFSCSVCYHRFTGQPELGEHMKRHRKNDTNEGKCLFLNSNILYYKPCPADIYIYLGTLPKIA